MEWLPILKPAQLEKVHTFFPALATKVHARIIASVLKRIEKYLKFPLGITIPYDTEAFLDDPESLRALRLLMKLKDKELLKSFHFAHHNFGDEPSGYVTTAYLKDTDRFGFSGKGSDMLDQSKTLWPAVGEAVERYAMHFYYPTEDNYRDATYAELLEPKVDIFSLAGFDSVFRAQGHEDFNLSFDEHVSFRWTNATELTTKKTVWAPLQWFSFAHMQRYVHKGGTAVEAGAHEPLLSPPITTGVATGQTTTDATLRGLLEVVERDAFIIYWLNQLTPKRIDTASLGDERINKMVKIAERYRLELQVLYLKTDVPVHTVCTLLIDRSGIGPALMLGSKSSIDLTDAVYSTISDILSQRGIYRRMMIDPEYKDRTYDDIRAIGHRDRIHYWFAADKLVHLDWFIKGDVVDAATLPNYTYPDNQEAILAQLVRFFSDKGYPVYAKELLNKYLKGLTEGLSVMMVKIPDMQPLALEESLPALGGKRLYEVPKFLGEAVKNNRNEFFTSIPHPFP